MHMSRIKLVTDGGCDIAEEIVKKYNIDIVRMDISFGNETFVSGKEIDNKTFYKKLEGCKELPKTACPSPNRFLESFKGEEENVLVICMTSKLSATYNSAVLAKDIIDKEGINKRVEVLDTLNGCIGQGQLVYKAAKLIEEGKNIDEIINEIESLKKNLPFFGTLETLENAIKGGRVNPIAGKIINALNFKAVIQISDGLVKPIDKARGEGNSLKKVIKLIDENVEDKENRTLFIGHANCEEKGLKVKEMIEKDYNFNEIVVCEVSSVMGTYTSKGAILICAL